jgi:predicted MarR family transcription regulator
LNFNGFLTYFQRPTEESMSRQHKQTNQQAQIDAPEADWAHAHWPLGRDPHDINTTEFEWAVMRFFSAFERSCLQLSITAGSQDLSFQELVLLHVVAMQHHAQTSHSIARQLNRDDIQNLQYALRKLEKRALIAKSDGDRSKTAHYSITPMGRDAVDLYAKIRAQLLTGRTELVSEIDEKLQKATQLLSVLTGVYDDVARVAATYSPMRGEDVAGTHPDD